MRWNIVIAAVALVLCVALVAGQKDSGPPKGTPKRSTGSADNKDSVKDAGKDTTKNEKPKPSPEAKVEAEKIAPKPPANDESILNTKQKDAGNDAAKNEKPKPPPKAKVETVKSAPKPPAKDERTLNTKPEPAKAAPQVQATVDALNEKGLGKLKSARILVMLPMPFYSHTKNFLPIFEELAKRGHKITMVSPFPQKKPLPNWEDIVTENVLYKMLANMNMTEITEMNKSFVSKVIGILFFGKATTKLLFELQPVIDLYNDNSREFDLVFVEAQFVQEPLLAFGWKYKAPVIALYPTYITPEVAYYTGNPVLTTNYVPNMVYGHSNKMNFLERFENTMYAVGKLLVYNLYYLPLMDSLVKEHFPAPDMPSIADMLFNVSFTLMDANLALAYPYPRANNIREFLGINTKPDVPLEPEIQQIMDGADQNGVLLFTLGSTFTASSLSSHVIESLMYTFSKIPQKVIMKWDKDEPPANLPANVHIVKWLPQAGILRHKNCRAFFTHTGVHGLMEAMDHGVPVISMPLFADQDFFANWVQENGVGLRVDFRTVTSKECLRVVSDVLNNPKYKENAVGVSIKMKDTPMPTLDEVVYWVEHVLRTKGARHLRPGSLNLWWYQRFGLDVLALALVVVLVPIWLMLFITRKCLSLVCRSKPNGSKTEKKKLKSKKDD